MTIFGLNMEGVDVDSRQAKVRRALVGAFYGLTGRRGVRRWWLRSSTSG